MNVIKLYTFPVSLDSSGCNNLYISHVIVVIFRSLSVNCAQNGLFIVYCMFKLF